MACNFMGHGLEVPWLASTTHSSLAHQYQRPIRVKPAGLTLAAQTALATCHCTCKMPQRPLPGPPPPCSHQASFYRPQGRGDSKGRGKAGRPPDRGCLNYLKNKPTTHLHASIPPARPPPALQPQIQSPAGTCNCNGQCLGSAFHRASTPTKPWVAIPCSLPLFY